MKILPILLLLVLILPQPPLSAQVIVRSEFIYDDPPTPQCHASTIVETEGGLVAAWFGGEHERHPEVGIWVARHENGRWSTPVEVADGVQGDGTRHPTWNPVLFQPEDGPLMLFYKVGPNPREWWGMRIVSHDEGRTWSAPERLPEGVIGPVKNKPVVRRRQRPQHAQRGVFPRWEAVGGGARAGERTGRRVFVSGRDPDLGRAGAHHLHLEAVEDSPHGGGSREAGNETHHQWHLAGVTCAR